MLQYVIRRLLVSIPTLLAISFVIFTVLDQAPGDPTSQLPLTLPAEIREQIRDSLGLNDPFLQRWVNWGELMLVNEPIHAVEQVTGACIGDCESRPRIISWASRAPALDVIYQRLPQTLWVMGLSLLFGIAIAIPIGVISAYRQYSTFDNVGTFVSMLGFSMPVYFTGLILIQIFSSWLGWFPSFYDTTHEVSFTSWSSIWTQIKQLAMPVTVLTLFNAASFARFTRASVLDNLSQDYVRTARSKGLSEWLVVNRHVLRNSLIPVVTLVALSIPGIFSGAILTETVFRINGLGQLLFVSIGQGDLPMVQTLTFIFAFLTVVFNLIADVVYGTLDPRIRYD
ncbi:MAG: ABC transporter permease [Actinomycetota bacterium]